MVQSHRRNKLISNLQEMAFCHCVIIHFIVVNSKMVSLNGLFLCIFKFEPYIPYMVI